MKVFVLLVCLALCLAASGCSGQTDRRVLGAKLPWRADPGGKTAQWESVRE